MKYYGFCHAVDAPESRRILTEQLYTIKDSGLLSRLQLTILCHGSYDYFMWAQSFVHDNAFANNVKVIHNRPFVDEFEFPTLWYLKDFCNKLPEEAYVVYFHHKGAYSGKHNLRRIKEYWTFTEWTSCIDKLNEGYDTVGHDAGVRAKTGLQWIPGNFWWARASFIKRLPELPFPDLPAPGEPDLRRFKCELWIGWIKHKSYNIAEINLLHKTIERQNENQVLRSN